MPKLSPNRPMAWLLPIGSVSLMMLSFSCSNKAPGTTPTVVNLPVISTSPESKTTSSGSDVTLSVAAAGGSTLYYQWQRSNDNGATFANVEGDAAKVKDYVKTVTPNDHNAKFKALVSGIRNFDTADVQKDKQYVVSSVATLTVNTASGATTTVAEPPSSAPLGITTGPDGHVWFTNRDANQIGKLNVITRLVKRKTLGANAQPTGIASGPDGKLWFTQAGAGKVASIATDAEAMTEYAVGNGPKGIAAGPDGHLWFTLETDNQIGRISTAGLVTRVAVPTAAAKPRGITQGPDGNLWFTEFEAGKIGRVKPDGTLTEWNVTGTLAPKPEGIISSGGKIWFADRANNRICRFADSAQPLAPTWRKGVRMANLPAVANLVLDEIPLDPGADPAGLTTDNQGNVWVTESGLGKLSKIPAGSTTPEDVPLPTTGGAPAGIAVGPDGNIWVAETDNDQITQIVTENTPPEITVAIDPPSVEMYSGQKQVFKAAVKGIPDESVTWIATGGTIENGIFTAPEVSSNATYTLTAVSTVDTSKKADVTILVKPAPPAPTISAFTATPTAVAPGGQVTLSATFVNQTGKGYISPGVGEITSGGAIPITMPTGLADVTVYTYTLSVVNGIGETLIQTLDVVVDPRPLASIKSFTTTPTEISAGQSATLSFQYAGVTAKLSSPGGVDIDVTGKTSQVVTPTSTTIYTLTVDGGLKSQATQTVEVLVTPPPGAPVISEFMASPATICTGESAMLFGSYMDGTGVVMPGSLALASGSHIPVTPTATTNYTLTVTGATAPPATRTVTVTVDPNPRASIVGFSAAPGKIDAGQTATLSFSGWIGTTASIIDGAGATLATLNPGTNTYVVTPPYSMTYTLLVNGGASSTAKAEATVLINPAITPDSVSGTVTYSGSKTGRIYVYLKPYGVMGNMDPVAGTTIDGPGNFVIRGVQDVPNASSVPYMLMARMDSLNTGAANVANPWGQFMVNKAEGVALTGQTVALSSDGMAPDLATKSAPEYVSASPMAGGAMVFWETMDEAIVDKDWELPDHYVVEWSTTSNFAVVAGSKTVLARDDGHCFISGLTDGSSYYFRVKGTAGGTSSPYGATVDPVTIGAVTGGFTVTGSVKFDGTLGMPLSVLVMNELTQEVRVVDIPNPVSPQAFSITGVEAGDYDVIAMVDMNQNGVKDLGDPFVDSEFGAPRISVSADVNVGEFTLPRTNALGMISTQHNRTVGVGSDDYGLTVEVMGNLKMPVALTVLTGPDITSPVDIPKSTWEGFNYWVKKGATAPVVDETYLAEVRYSDGTVERVEAKVTGVLNTFATNLQTNQTNPYVPIFSWAAPATPPTWYGYRLNVQRMETGMPPTMLWEYPDHGWLPSSKLSATYNEDGRANGSTLTTGNIYNWSVTVTDAKGNRATLWTQDITVP